MWPGKDDGVAGEEGKNRCDGANRKSGSRTKMYRLGGVGVGWMRIASPRVIIIKGHFPFSCALFVKLIVFGSECIFVLASGLGDVGKKRRKAYLD